MNSAVSDERLAHFARHEKDLDVLAAISAVIANESAQPELLRSVLRILEEGLGMRRGAVMLLQPDGKELVIGAVERLPESTPRDTRYRTGEGIVGAVVKTGQPAIIPRVSDEPRFQNRIHQREGEDLSDVSFLCVPIAVNKNVVGTLSVDVPRRPAEELHDQLRVLTITAGMIGFDVRSRQAGLVWRQSLEAENLRLRDALSERFRPENIVGNSHSMREVYLKIQQVASSDTTVLIRGESGTGKELVASAIHYNSLRANGPMVKLNCAALNENLLESELFGHEKDAFTGALFARIGRLEEAEGGTLFLDEIGDFSPSIQVKLLRVLQERQYERVGSNRTVRADVRVIAATNQDLEARTQTGLFRRDLYYRIHVFPITLPPLRDRRDDILLLADHFVAKYAKKMSKSITRISTPAIDMLFAYHWPGNVRELENCIEYAVLLARDGVIHGADLPPTLQMPDVSDSMSRGAFRARMEMLERDLISDAMKSCDGSIAQMAEWLGITQRMVRYKLKRLGLDQVRRTSRSH